MKLVPLARPAKASTSDIGRDKERLAEKHLRRQGLKILERNYRSRFGEIDLIALHDEVLVFVEVRYRRQRSHGSPAESVDRRKQQRLGKTARLYLQAHPTMLPCRFDVVSISGPDHIDWIKHAFVLDAD